MAALAAAYFATAKVSLAFAIPPGYATAVWPPAGIALAALWLRGPSLWPGVWIGAAAANYTIASAISASLAIGTGNALEALAGAWLARRALADRRGPFSGAHRVFIFVAITLACAVVAASAGAGTLYFSGAMEPGAGGTNWLTWWLGDAAGMMIITPLIAAWARPSQFGWSGRRMAELAALVLVLLAAAGEVFTGWLFGRQALPLTFLVVPLAIWAGIRFDYRVVTTLCALLVVIALATTVAGKGPFAGRTLNESLLLQQAFFSTLAVTGLVLAALMYELRRMAETLRRAHGEMEQMVHLAAHDLQEPLRTVLSFADLLELRYRERLGAEGQEFLRFVAGGAALARRLIQDLLEVAEAGRRPLELERVSSQLAMNEALDSLRGAIEGAAAEVKGGPLPVVRADWRMLQSLFQNLIGNAIKYRSAQPPRIEISAEPRGSSWIFSVRDNGIGIDPRYHEVIFGLFKRLAADGAVPGTGSGLTLCKRMVERHGGRIWVESAQSQGATFRFSLPREESEHGERG